ncbi:hypothetical protein EIP91_009454 [Steccherinum ochraceum]|uniref:Uncharacterized protein n=1 Tax=Steccherinum ochraceum TaxID=92696 RepID=A0A4R0RZV9_9APHY|nr:hypothetical protein EIP91_009454 [Steccherinum ochraceum]
MNISVVQRVLRLSSRHIQPRLLHSTSVRHDLVGPPDPVSNLRPVVYDDAPPEIRSPNDTHPYSLKEFRGDAREYQWKMQRQQLDAYNLAYWTDSNTRFEGAKQAMLTSLPESTTEEEREFALSEFYYRWLVQEEERSKLYNEQWNKQNWSTIWLGARVKFDMLWSRITGRTPPSSS